MGKSHYLNEKYTHTHTHCEMVKKRRCEEKKSFGSRDRMKERKREMDNMRDIRLKGEYKRKIECTCEAEDACEREYMRFRDSKR